MQCAIACRRHMTHLSVFSISLDNGNFACISPDGHAGIAKSADNGSNSTQKQAGDRRASEEPPVSNSTSESEDLPAKNGNSSATAAPPSVSNTTLLNSTAGDGATIPSTVQGPHIALVFNTFNAPIQTPLSCKTLNRTPCSTQQLITAPIAVPHVWMQARRESKTAAAVTNSARHQPLQVANHKVNSQSKQSYCPALQQTPTPAC